ncbi:hypothetical protein [Streptomyces alanosinicus]|uniref:Uncharacterized protein n=1 Tax=Streptomyces alanosinicus TaxID=68171 RepID=A0A919D774_9ACTN|nr:hypothetical protein [Streptomyces alanosinicus]GHE13741.1 hypothetical protein GCM10010339_81720 [Streptomyces alanosinicus]
MIHAPPRRRRLGVELPDGTFASLATLDGGCPPTGLTGDHAENNTVPLTDKFLGSPRDGGTSMTGSTS